MLVVVAAYVVYRNDPGGDSPSAQPSGAAAAALSSLVVSAPGTSAGYDREEFGPAWADVDGNGCDTRNDILGRDLRHVVRDQGGCIVLSGVLSDPYTAKKISFTRGAATSAAVQIDHVVALMDAWRTGASSWSADKRREFANDPLNLLAVDGPANQGKGADDASQWIPPNNAYACPYVARQIAVKAKYGLSVTTAERDAMRRVLTGCPDQRLP